MRYDEQAHQQYIKARDLAQRISDRMRLYQGNYSYYQLLSMRALHVSQARERYWRQSFRSPKQNHPQRRRHA
jgi:hypothetical protein